MPLQSLFQDDRLRDRRMRCELTHEDALWQGCRADALASEHDRGSGLQRRGARMKTAIWRMQLKWQSRLIMSRCVPGDDTSYVRDGTFG